MLTMAALTRLCRKASTRSGDLQAFELKRALGRRQRQLRKAMPHGLNLEPRTTYAPLWSGRGCRILM
jgi:hypothetical protein